MAKEPDDKTPESIKRHKPIHTLEMRGPDGARIRQNEAADRVEKERQAQNGDRAAKYAKVEKASIAKTSDMEQGTKGLLKKEMTKAAKDKDFDR